MHASPRRLGLSLLAIIVLSASCAHRNTFPTDSSTSSAARESSSRYSSSSSALPEEALIFDLDAEEAEKEHSTAPSGRMATGKEKMGEPEPGNPRGEATEDGISFTLTADSGEAVPGQRIWFEIAAANLHSTPLQRTAVEVALPEGKLTVTDRGTAILDGNVLRWVFENIAAGQTRVLRFQGEVARGLPHGDSVIVILTARTPSLPTPLSATSIVRIVDRLPTAGAGGNTGPLEDTSRSLRPYKK